MIFPIRSIPFALCTASVAIGALLLPTAALAADIDVPNKEALKAALTAAKPGDTLLLADGKWPDVALRLTTPGTAQAPITLRAKTGGEVLFTGSSSLIFSAPDVTVDGIRFQEGGLGPKGKQVVRFNSTHCRLTNSAIIKYNPPSSRPKTTGSSSLATTTGSITASSPAKIICSR